MGLQPVMQYSFNSGEWAPALNARVDIAKYHSGAALLRNFFVDYRGGATVRPGTRYVIQSFLNSGVVTRLIPFQASFTVSYMLEFGNLYVRFINQGAPVLESGLAITGATNASPCVVTVNNTFIGGGADWVYITGVQGMTQLNGNFYIVGPRTPTTITLKNLDGTDVDATGYGAYTSGGQVQRLYKISSPYSDVELEQVKFAQSGSTMILCHPNHPPYQLILVNATAWTLTPITFGSTIAAPTGQSVATTLAGGNANYAYVITAVDVNGQESSPSAFATLANFLDLRTNYGTNTVTWSAVTGAVSYNIYKAEIRAVNPVPAGAQFGFVGNCTALTFIDSNINPDFTQCPPVPENPFSGSGVGSVSLTAGGSYAGGTVPTISFTGGGGGSGAAAIASAQISTVTVVSGGFSFFPGDTVTIPDGVVLRVTATDGFGHITAVVIINQGIQISSGSALPTNPAAQVSSSGSGISSSFTMTYKIVSVGVTSPGSGYSPAPNVVFSSGAATATATLGAPSSGNPTVPGFVQQRLFLGGPVSSPQQFNMSQPAAYYNFNITDPVQPDNAIQETLVSGQLNTIQSVVSQPQGLIVFTDKLAWLINGGSPGAPISATQLVANSQAYNGAHNLPPIVATNDILYVQSKGSIVRDLAFNFYTQVYTGADISVLSSHLFYNYALLEWAWAEEPFKVVWAVRNDGIMLNLTFLKEQELVAWTHSDTQGQFVSVGSITEQISTVSAVDAVYCVVKRVINGSVFQYIERFVEQVYTNGATDAWQVDSGIQYNGSPVTSFTGARSLGSTVVTGLATDDKGNVTVITPFTMPGTGNFTLPAPPAPATGYTRVTIGLGFTAQLQTLAIDLGEPTVQGKRKKIPAITVRVKDALGLKIGGSFSTLVPMKDLVIGNVGSASNQVVTNLVTTDARTIVEPNWTVPGQYVIQQDQPYPASILGVIPEITVGDTK